MAKGKNEVCGGPWGTSGYCASGLNCLKISKYYWDLWQVEGRCVNPVEVLLNPPSELFTKYFIIEKNFNESNYPIQKCPGAFSDWNTPWNKRT